MTIADQLQRTNKFMIGFDLALGPGRASRPCGGPSWLTFVAAHATAASRSAERHWWALAWLRGTEIATGALWSRSSAVSRPGAKLARWGAGVSNLSMALGFAWLARSP